MKSSITIVLPTLNETELPAKIETLAWYLQAHPYEIIVVDDSSDEAFERLSVELKNKGHVRLIKGERKRKGHAVKKGILESKGSIVFYIDADLRIPLENIPVFIHLIEQENFDLVMAQRPFDQTPRPWLRSCCSMALLCLARGVVFQSSFFQDTQCGFKAIKGDAARAMAKRQMIDGGMVDIEYLYMARRNQLKIDRVSIVPLAEIRPSRINLWRCIFSDVFDLFRIRIQGMRGQYQIQ